MPSPEISLKIFGFGACMVAGYPFPQEFSFFSRLVEELAAVRSVDAKVVSLSGFLIDRARRHLAAKVLSHHPDYVVVQFGSSDAIAELQRYLRRRLGRLRKASARKGLSAAANNPSPVRAASLAFSVRWRVKGLIARWLRVPPRTPRQVYRQSVAAIASEIIASGGKPIILTPFLFGDSYSNEFGAQYAADVENLGRELGFAVVNSQQVLRQYPACEVLLADGFHLSDSSSTVRTLPNDKFSKNAGFFMHLNRPISKCSAKF